MSNVLDTIIIGAGGAMGSSAAMHLALRGCRVLGIDQFEFRGHDRGSSHGRSRMIRMCYYEHPDYVPLLKRAYELWRDLETRTGVAPGSLLSLTGGLYMGPPGSEVVTGSLRAAREHGLAHQMLTRADLLRRFPQFAVPDDFVALHEPMAGFLRPEAVIAAQANAAALAGAELHGHEMVTAWRSDGGGVTVTTQRGEYTAAQLVISGGAWQAKLCGARLPVHILPTRQVLGWVRPRPGRESAFALGTMPVWAIDAAHLGEGLYYGFPMLPDAPPYDGFKLAMHAPGPACDPDDERRREPRPEDEDTFRPCLERWIPDANGPTLATATCMYENSSDGHFVIDQHPDHPNVTLACGFSGHGFKFASVVGEIVADLVTGGQSRHSTGFLGLSRFRNGQAE